MKIFNHVKKYLQEHDTETKSVVYLFTLLFVLFLPLLVKILLSMATSPTLNSQKTDIKNDISGGFLSMCAISLLAPMIYTIERITMVNKPKQRLSLKLIWFSLIAAILTWSVLFVTDIFEGGLPFGLSLVVSGFVLLISLYASYKTRIFEIDEIDAKSIEQSRSKGEEKIAEGLQNADGNKSTAAAGSCEDFDFDEMGAL